MSLVLVLILFGLGIAYTQWICASEAVTLRWLRLGDLIALSLLTAALALATLDPADRAGLDALFAPGLVLAIGFIAHLTAVQLGRRRLQRIIIGTLATVVTVASLLASSGIDLVPIEWSLIPFEWRPESSPAVMFSITISTLLSALLLGGYLMTMLLGHAYLTAGGEMTQRPFLRLNRVLLIAVGVRLLWAGVGASVWWAAMRRNNDSDPQLWNGMLVAVRFLVGLVVPVIMTWMAAECVKIRSNQSATGILYVASILILIGELTALMLMADLAVPF